MAGRCHGYLRGEALRAKVAEINARAPDYLWVALGAPYEQAFVDEVAPALANVGVIKTSGGLFNFRSGCSVPVWNRLGASGWSHAAVALFDHQSPALYLLLSRSRPADIGGKNDQ
jgi:hypothetical protein